MYICILARAYPGGCNGLEGIFERDQALALQAAGHKVVYAALDMRSIRRKRPFGYTCFVDQGLKVHSMSIPLGLIPHGVFVFFGKLAFRCLMRKIEKAEGIPELIHAHYGPRGEIAGDYCKKNEIPLVLTVHESRMFNPSISQKRIRHAKRGYQMAAACLAVSSPFATWLHAITGIPFRVVHNIVDTNAFYRIRTEKSDSIKRFSFVSTGNLVPGKGFDILLAAFAQVHEEFPFITLDLFGDGAERNRLEQFVGERKLADAIVFHGRTARERIGEFYSKADCFVLATRRETFGVSYIEAMASGLPVIATACGGPEDFVQADNGILIPGDDEDALLNAMRDMVLNISRYDGMKIAEDTVRRFSPETIARQLEALYRELQ